MRKTETTHSPAQNAAPRRRTLRRLFLAAVLVMLTVLGAYGCEQPVDVSTPEGAAKALETGEKVEDAIEAIGQMKPEERAKLGKELQKFYLKGSPHDDKVLGWLVSMKDPAYKEAYIKGVGSGRVSQAAAAASAIGELGLSDAADALANAFEGTGDREIKQAILEAASRIESERLGKLAATVLIEKNPDDEHISVLRESCRVIAKNPNPEFTRAALKGLFYADQAGRRITDDCVLAVLAIGKPAVPAIIEMIEGKNEEIARHIKRHADIYTEETVLLQGAQLLSRLRPEEGRDILVRQLQDPTPFAPPQVLAAKPTTDPAWGGWAALIGQVNQEVMLALNDIGIAGNEDARTALIAIYKWQEPYPQKFDTAIRKGGSTMIEIAARVNAARLLVENGFLDDPDALQDILATLKDPAFNDEGKVRPAARAAITQDLVTYLAIASKPGWTETVWKFFDAMASAELDEKRYKLNYDFNDTRVRIADVKSAFELADKCAEQGVDCYAKVLQEEKPDRYQELKAIYELGKQGKAEHFPLVLARYDDVDQALGYLYANSTLQTLGDASRVAEIDALIEEGRKSMDDDKFKFMESSLKLVRNTLAARR